MVVVVMGPAGSGKTTVGSALATALGWRLLDADTLHPPENVARLRSGQALTDDQRAPWLAAVAAAIAGAVERDEPLVVACSALRRSYRAALRPAPGIAQQVLFVYLKVSRAELARRLADRTDHFAPATLLSSQLATLEEPHRDELDVITVDAEQPVVNIVHAIRRVAFRNTP